MDDAATSGSDPTTAGISTGPVIVGVDGSRNSARALGVACDLAARLGIELVVVHAVGLMSVIDGEHVPSEGRRDDLARLLDEWTAPLANIAGLRWHAELVDGAPAEVVEHRAEEVGASVVVVGTRGAGDDRLLGSTSHHLVQHSQRPVLVVPDRPASG